MVMVSANETFKKILNPSGEMNVGAYITSGAAAGALVRVWRTRTGGCAEEAN
jgi:hypothetical protein